MIHKKVVDHELLMSKHYTVTISLFAKLYGAVKVKDATSPQAITEGVGRCLLWGGGGGASNTWLPKMPPI